MILKKFYSPFLIALLCFSYSVVGEIPQNVDKYFIAVIQENFTNDKPSFFGYSTSVASGNGSNSLGCVISESVCLGKLIDRGNVDVKFLTIIQEYFTQDHSTNFGYTISLAHGDSQERSGWVFVGAPKSNVSVTKGKGNESYVEPGVVWRCSLGLKANEKCEILHFLDQLCVDKVKNLRNGRKNEDFGNCDASLMGGSLTFENDILVSCAPTWNRKKKLSGNSRVDGACYWMNRSSALDENLSERLANNSVSSERGYLIPFQDANFNNPKTSGLMFGTGQYDIWLRWYYAQSGFSTHVTKTKEILLGAPGTLIEKGTMLKVEPREYNTWSFTNTEKYQNYSRFFQRFGYDISSGYFLDKTKLLLTGSSPLADPTPEKTMFGAVLIIEPESMLNSEEFVEKKLKNLPQWSSKDVLVGIQFGSYFGASILSLDINGDDLDDLLVGAPFEKISSSGIKLANVANVGDHGCVYIYSKKEDSLFRDYRKRICGNFPGGRFGISMAKLGDLNQDGYNDFAIGAPYEEGSGTVYIYYGERDLNFKMFPIRGKDYKPQVKFLSFGYSIAGGVDLDGNGTPDFSIGSYLDKRVVIFRTRPILQINHEIFTYNLNRSEHPIILEKNATQFQIELCINIRIKSNTGDLKHENRTVIHGEVKIDAKQDPKRFAVLGQQIISQDFIFDSVENRSCRTFNITRNQVPDELEDQEDVTVEFQFWYNQTANQTTKVSALQIIDGGGKPKIETGGPTFQEFCSTCPYPKRTDRTSFYITFKKECRHRGDGDAGEMPVCVPDLHITLVGKYGDDCHNLNKQVNETNLSLKLGDSPCLQIIVQVKNIQQIAYSPRLHLSWSWNSEELAQPSIPDKGDLCKNIEDKGTSLDCKLDRVKTYLGNNVTQSQDFKFLMERIYPVSSNSKKFEVTAKVYLEADSEFTPVTEKITINYAVNAGIDLLEGSVTNNSFPISRPDQLSYRFKVRISGTTPVKVHMLFFLPTSIVWRGEKIKMFSITDQPKLLTCNEGSKNNPILNGYRQHLPEGKGNVVDASNFVFLNCTFDLTRHKRFMDLRFGLKLLEPPLARRILMSEGKPLDFYAMASARILDLEPTINVTRLIINPPERGGLRSWIVLAAAGCGLFMFLLLLIILIKCGFFKRDMKDKLGLLKAEEEKDMGEFQVPFGSKDGGTEDFTLELKRAMNDRASILM